MAWDGQFNLIGRLLRGQELATAITVTQSTELDDKYDYLVDDASIPDAGNVGFEGYRVANTSAVAVRINGEVFVIAAKYEADSDALRSVEQKLAEFKREHLGSSL